MKKPSRIVKPDPKDPEWTFPFATRHTMEKILVYFQNLPNNPKNWHDNPHTHALKPKEAAELRKETNWPSVPPEHRQRVEEWFQRTVARIRAERGGITPGKLRSLRMNAAYYGRHVLTMKRSRNRLWYERRKLLLFAYREWQEQEELRNAPKLQSRRLSIG